MVLAPHLAAVFPVYLHLGSYTIHPHLFFESLAYLVAFAAYLTLRRRFGDPIPTPLRWAVVAAAIAGAALGAKLLSFFEDPRLTLANLHNPSYFVGGKTIVGALVSGLLTVELLKRYVGLRTSTGDLYAVPLALGIAIGRIGCFLTGLSDNTYGTPANLPWAVNFGDGIPRHPTQLYEIAFLLALIPLLYSASTRIVILSEAESSRNEDSAQSKDLAIAGATTSLIRNFHFTLAAGISVLGTRVLPGDAFKLFMVAYMTFRLLCDFLKPYPRLFLGLGAIQCVCVLTLLYYFPDLVRWLGLRAQKMTAR